MRLEKFKRLTLSIAIMIVLALFVNVGINTFYDEPENDCYDRAKPFRLCEGEEREKCFEEQEKINEEQQKCFDEYQPQRELYQRNVFLILLVAGIATILIGFSIGVGSVSSGLVLGGILNIIIGVMIYWSSMQEFLRFIILGIALVILIYVGYKKIN